MYLLYHQIACLYIRRKKETDSAGLLLLWSYNNLLYLTFRRGSVRRSDGFCSIVQKTEQNALGSGYSDEFMICALTAVTLVLRAAVVFRKSPTICGKAVLYPLLCGAANGLTNLLVLIIIAFAAVSVFFPMISAGQLLASLIFAVFLYREKLSKRMYPAAALGLASYVLLNI